VADEVADKTADDGDRWTVRGVSRDARTLMKARADACGQSVGQWLTAAVMSSASGPTDLADAADSGRQTVADRTADKATDPVADIGRLVSAASELAAAGSVPPGLRAALNRAMREQARGLGAPVLALPSPERTVVRLVSQNV
jgi:hypothetical protein